MVLAVSLSLKVAKTCIFNNWTSNNHTILEQAPNKNNNIITISLLSINKKPIEAAQSKIETALFGYLLCTG